MHLRTLALCAYYSRAPVSRPFRSIGPSRDNPRESITLAVMEALSSLAASAPSPFVRAHAAAWFTMGKAALRYEQACGRRGRRPFERMSRR